MPFPSYSNWMGETLTWPAQPDGTGDFAAHSIGCDLSGISISRRGMQGTIEGNSRPPISAEMGRKRSLVGKLLSDTVHKA